MQEPSNRLAKINDCEVHFHLMPDGKCTCKPNEQKQERNENLEAEVSKLRQTLIAKNREINKLRYNIGTLYNPENNIFSILIDIIKANSSYTDEQKFDILAQFLTILKNKKLEREKNE